MYLVFDIGGTNMRLATSKDGRNLDESRTFPTPMNFEKGVSDFREVVRELTGGQVIDAAAGGLAGPLDNDKSLVLSFHLQDWAHKPIKESLQQAINAPVYLENDAALGGLGEAIAGAGKGASIVAYITVGTGVGGVRIVDGAIDANALGFEPGYQIIDPNGGVDISGWAVEERYGKSPQFITDPTVWEELALRLAYLLNNTIVHWSPHVVVLGGSMILGSPRIPVDRVEFHLQNVLKVFPQLPPIRAATLGDTGGLHGALWFLRQQIHIGEDK